MLACVSRSKAPAAEAREQTAGEKMMNALKRRGKPMTTEELAKVAGLSTKDAYSRLWWLQKKEHLLKSTGAGKERLWTFSARGAKSMVPAAPNAA
jgi:response regulator of citrate/malate metabolism